jgi:hypothetical protein
MSCKIPFSAKLRPFGAKNRLPNGVKMTELTPLLRRYGINIGPHEIQASLLTIRDNYLSAQTHRIVPGSRGKGNGYKVSDNVLPILLAFLIDKREEAVARWSADIAPLRKLYVEC